MFSNGKSFWQKKQKEIQPVIKLHPLWDRGIAISYGPYFVRESIGSFRVFRQRKETDDHSWCNLIEAKGEAFGCSTNALKMSKDDDWCWVYATPLLQGNATDCKFRFQHLKLGEGSAARGTVDGLCTLAFGESRCLDEGDLLISDRHATYFANAALKIQDTLSTLKGASMPQIKGRLVSDNTKEFDSGSLKGKVVLVDFWATWCGPCIEKLPEVDELYRKYRDRGFEVVGVHLTNGASDAVNSESAKGLSFPLVIANPHTEDLYAVRSVPAYFLVSRDGKIAELLGHELPTHEQIEIELKR